METRGKHAVAITFHELKERLKQVDEVSLLEVLGLTSEDLVERFDDIIETRYEELQEEFQELDSDS